MNFWRSWNKSSRRRSGLLWSTTAVLALLVGLGAGGLPPTTSQKPQDRLIEFSLPDIAGRHRDIREWKGKLLLLNFWATWCAPCREEIPLLNRMQRRYGQRGLQIIGVALDRAEAVSTYQKEIKLDYPVLVGDDAFDLLRQYGNRHSALPFNVLIAPDGQILARKLGAYTGSELEILIYPHLKLNMR